MRLAVLLAFLHALFCASVPVPARAGTFAVVASSAQIRVASAQPATIVLERAGGGHRSKPISLPAMLPAAFAVSGVAPPSARENAPPAVASLHVSTSVRRAATARGPPRT